MPPAPRTLNSSVTTFRRPIPAAPIESFDIAHPALPDALDGLTVLHVSDLHLRARQDNRASLVRLTNALASVQVDLVALTGDFVDKPGAERAAIETLELLASCWRTRLAPPAAFGVFGNHDTVPFRRLAERAFEGRIHWLDAGHVDLDIRGGRLRILGAHWPEDLVGAAIDAARADENKPNTTAAHPPFTLTLAHMPTAIVSGASLGLPLILAGHTHAGQIRLSPRLAPHTSSDIPAHLAAGVLRLNDTLCCVSRGLGEAILERLRINCPRQIPLYTLRRAPLPEPPEGTPENVVTQVVAW